MPTRWLVLVLLAFIPDPDHQYLEERSVIDLCGEIAGGRLARECKRALAWRRGSLLQLAGIAGYLLDFLYPFIDGSLLDPLYLLPGPPGQGLSGHSAGCSRRFR